MHLASDKWFDGSWWEADLPDTWQLTEKSAQHIRLAENKSRVLIGFRKGCKLHEISRRDYPPDAENPSESEIWAYTSTKTLSEWWPASLLFPFLHSSITKVSLGCLSGYTCNRSKGLTGEIWSGYLSSSNNEWGVYVRLEGTASKMKSNQHSIADVLASIEFRA